MRETLLVLVSGRGALAELAGVPSVERHVQAGVTLGLDVVVVYPPERRALGAEIRGLVEQHATCLPADQFQERYAGELAGTFPLLVAAEWYLSLASILAVRDTPSTRVFGRVCERGCISVPLARVAGEDALAVTRQLGSSSAAASLAALFEPSDLSIEFDPRGEQRLSDNISTAHAEEKLLRTLFGTQRMLPVLRLRPTIAPLLARRFSHTILGPTRISALKLVLGLAAAWIIQGGSYYQGLVGALLYLAARLLGASGIVLSRASLTDGDIRERLDLAGDTVLHIAVLWALAGGPARGDGAVLLAAIATAGVLISTGVAYVFVLREHWDFRRAEANRIRSEFGDAEDGPAPHSSAAGDEFVSRFVQRDGIAYAILFAAGTGSLDLFLWAAAVASHLFYILWLLARPRGHHGEGDSIALGRPA